MLKTLLANMKELPLIVGMLLILVVLFAPIPPMALDLAILMNVGFSLTILLLTFYVAKPVEFSTFPSLLLIATLFRLSLNVAATRLILTSAAAGEVINAIGAFAVSGNFVVGLVVFFILIVVQYVVVTSGAQRVSEVAARFTLDSMPGQQMSIDADLNMGLIDQKEALRRRAELEKEAAFYGAMDGASKFVKGDAIAGVIVLLINIIAGWIIGVIQMSMSWGEALQRFSLLTIGDGIATQLPALIISIATGIIVTRSSADKELSTEVLRQLSSTPRALLIVAGTLSLFLLLPGMPKWPLVIIAAAAGYGIYRLRRRPPSAAGAAPESAAAAASNAPPALSVFLGEALFTAWRASESVIMERIGSLRDAQERALGVAFPAVKLMQGAQLAPAEYEISVFGARHGGGEIQPTKTLAIRGQSTARIAGQETLEPAFGLPAVWIEPGAEQEARDAGYTIVDPLTVFITHLGEIVRSEAGALLTRPLVVQLLDEVRARQPGLVEELIPTLLSVSDVQKLMQSLLSEGVPVSAVDLIVEHLVDVARTEKDSIALTESLRQRLANAICNKLRGRHRELSVMSLDPRLENQIQIGVAGAAKRDALPIDPRLAERLIRRLAEMADDMVRQGCEPVLLCSGETRRAIRVLTRRAVPKLSVLSVQEIPMNIDLRSQGVVRVDLEDGKRGETIAPLSGAAGPAAGFA